MHGAASGQGLSPALDGMDQRAVVQGSLLGQVYSTRRGPAVTFQHYEKENTVQRR